MSESPQAEPTQPESPQAEPPQAEPTQPESPQAESPQAEPRRPESPQAESPQPEPRQPETGAAASTGRTPFGARLRIAMAEFGPLCVGIDPHPALLQDWGLNDDVQGLQTFCLTVLEALNGAVGVLKPQVALFERFGSRGIAVLERVLADARDRGILTIADAKRGDIGSTMEAYAQAWLGDGSPLAADAVTLSPYLGFESLRPALNLANSTGRGLFVLALTSNPEGAAVQHRGGKNSVAQAIVEAAGLENRSGRTDCLGSVGVVVGATVGAALSQLAIDLPAMAGPVLAPGLGAQGASAEDIRRTFGPAFPQVLATSSRDVLRAGPSQRGLREAALRTASSLAAAGTD